MIAEARQHVADALAALPVPVHAYPPATVASPAALVLPGSPYKRSTSLAGGALIGLEIRLVVTTAAGPGIAARALDVLIDEATDALAGRPGIKAADVQEPVLDDTAGTLHATIPVTVSWKR